METYIETPLTKDKVLKLNAGESVLLTGTIYTARDSAHKRMIQDILEGTPPFNMNNQIIYYAGPTPAKPTQIIGSCGPTTSLRMDKYTPTLIENGLTGMIGKGGRNKNVIESMVKNTAIYFAAIGGAGALLAKHIKSAKIIAYQELGTEAIFELKVSNFPILVAIDCNGNNIYNK